MGEVFAIFKDQLSSYSYASCQDLLKEYGYEEEDIYKLVRSFKYSVNFDFDYALKVLQTTSAEFKHKEIYREIRLSLDKLIEGIPEKIFCELLFSMRIQVYREEFVDFLGRLYRYREALLKYVFLKTQGYKDIKMSGPEMQKRYQTDILKEKYNINIYNLGHAISVYLRQYHKKDAWVVRVLDTLDNERMLELMNLRNDSIIGHGVSGVSERDIEEKYGTIERLIRNFKDCLGFAGLRIEYDKYDKWNNYIVLMAKELEIFQKGL